MNISVILPTFNPDLEIFERALAGLRAQTLDPSEWECIIVDNASAPRVNEEWCSHILGASIGLRLVREPTPGLSHARLSGLRNASADILIFCDDDNIFSPNYLESVITKTVEFPRVGVAGGKSFPQYLASVPGWYQEGIAPLGCRDLGDREMTFLQNEFEECRQYPAIAPIGAGLVAQRAPLESWVQSVGKSGISDRKGTSLSSAGDCDMVLFALESGFDVAYWPELVLEHVMPEFRLSLAYLCAISRCAFRDFVKVLDFHGIRPWPAVHPLSVLPRLIKAWFTHRAWRSPADRISWQSSVGQFEGRASLK